MKPQSLYTSILLIIKLIKFYSNYAGFYSYMITVIINHKEQLQWKYPCYFSLYIHLLRNTLFQNNS